MSQERLAEASGCDRSYLSFVERGINSPSLDMVFRLAKGLGLKPSALLARVEEELVTEGHAAELATDANP
jgi:transcriptional regulator with XRE-family HTH domain